MKAVEDQLKEKGLKDKVKTIIGSGSVSEDQDKVKMLMDSTMATVEA